MCRLGSGDDWRVSDKGEVDARVGDEIGLEFVQIDVERAIETERRSDRRDDYEDVSGLVYKENAAAYPER